MPEMRVLVALDKFKDSLTAPEACAAVAEEIRRSERGWEVDCCPLADGGEGFTAILTAAAGGSLSEVEVEGPMGRPASALLGLVRAGAIPAGARSMLGDCAGDPEGLVAVADMASASGLALVPAGLRDLRRASSVGTGQLLLAASRTGAGGILLGVGGSATHDLGLGALGALGIRYHLGRRAGSPSATPADWPGLTALGGALPGSFPEVRIACDVDNPLLGPSGALATYGPQKGLSPADMDALERSTERVAGLMCRHFGMPPEEVLRRGSGAAGGIAFGLMASLGATLVPGFELVSRWLDLDRRIQAADMVVTGEGRFDGSSLQGKGPGAVACRALGQGKTVHVFAGAVHMEHPPVGLAVHAITPAGMLLDQALASANALLRESVRRNLS